jgi:hypothetical protein
MWPCESQIRRVKTGWFQTTEMVLRKMKMKMKLKLKW